MRTQLYYIGPAAECTVKPCAADPGHFDVTCWDITHGEDVTCGLTWERARELFSAFVAEYGNSVPKGLKELRAKEWLSVNEAAKVLGTSPRNMAQSIARGDIEAYEPISARLGAKHTANSRERRINIHDLDAYMRSVPAKPRIA